MATDTKTAANKKTKAGKSKPDKTPKETVTPAAAMAKANRMDASILEKIGDSFNNLGESFMGLISRLFGSSNERYVKNIGYVRPKNSPEHVVLPGSILAQVNDLEEAMEELDDGELKAKTDEFRERLENGETLDDILPEAFAACREAGRRTKGMRHYDVQIVGGVVLHRGDIAEMVTGEGKTLVATLPAYLNGLTGKGVHIITVNDYLARRDCEWMSPIYHALGLTCGYIQSDMDPVDRRKAYDCDITYGTNSEFGFDYLRDNMKPARWGDDNYPTDMHQCQKALHYAIIDEVDNILVDEARTPLIISGEAHGDLKKYSRANDIVLQLNDLEKRAQQEQKVSSSVDPNDPNALKGYYFQLNEKEHSCHLTDEGVRKAEELAGVESFYTAGNMEWPHLIDNALKAHHLYKKDKHYVVMRHPETREMAVVIVDEFTGRLMVGRQWSDGLHQAVEAKHAREGVKIKQETQTLATITLQNFFKLYDKLSGMTGTAMTEANEFWKIYKLDVIAVPTNKPLVRDDRPDLIYMTEKEKWVAVADEIERIHKWDILTLAGGEEIVGTATAEDEWTTYTLGDGTTIDGTIVEDEDEDEDEEDETVTIKLRGKNKTQVVSVEDIASEEHHVQIVIQPKGSKEKKTFTDDEFERYEPRGRPILIGTTTVEKSDKLSAQLKKRGIKHELLNAKPEYAAREAEIVAQAGRIGAVTIATNMAGRGTDIVLGGNVEFLAWAKLSSKYETRLDVPPDVWKETVEEIEAREKMKVEGRRVAHMGGLVVIGTERHEARRIDNQLRGRAGRQGDPGVTRFYLCLEDDLMRIFAGDWVKGVLQWSGMEAGQAIESRMVSRRIEGAQKKVEERNFDIRRNLLEYDEVMDHQRKEVYGYRQRILEGANCKMLICEMLYDQISKAVDAFSDPSYGPASFAEFVSNRLSTEYGSHEFMRMDFEQAERYAREKAFKRVPTAIHEAMEENLNPDAEDKSEWNWQAMASNVNTRFGFKYNERQLKQIGTDHLAENLIIEANKVVEEFDLSEGQHYLDTSWGLRSTVDWVRLTFGIQMEADELEGKEPEELKEIIYQHVKDLYQQKDAEFPVRVAIGRFMADGPRRAPGAGIRSDREGLFQWGKDRFAKYEDLVKEDEFKTESRSKLTEKLIDVSKHNMPEEMDQFDIDDSLMEAFGSDAELDEETATAYAEWLKENLGLEIEPSELMEIEIDEARTKLWNLYDATYRREMRKMERSLLLQHVDSSWKNHLHVMDHLRSSIGLRGVAQEDPKTEYKREGMKMFEEMWNGLRDKISDTIFRMEDADVSDYSLWDITEFRHDEAASAASMAPPEGSIMAEQQQAIQNSQQAEGVKAATIRNRKQKVGRNDPCPCGSGKKYKSCCLRRS